MNHSKNSFTIYDMCTIAIFTAIISVLAQIAIPMPSGVPFTLQTFAITLTAVVLGAKKGAVAVLIYLLIGAVGVPVFTNFRGGLQAFVGPTGGFLLSFPVMTFLIGFGAEKREIKWFYPLMLILGTIVNYIVGIILYCFVMSSTVSTAFFACVLPFIPSTIITSILASMLGLKIKKRLRLGSL